MKGKIVSFKVMKKLAAELYKADRRRNLTASLAIALSAMLVILVLSTIISITDILQREKQMLVGSEAEGIYLSTSYYWYEQLRNNGKFDEVELVANMGTYETKHSVEETNYILFAKEKTADWNFNELLEGRWPQKEGETVVDELFVERNGGNVRVGDKLDIKLKTYVEESEYELEVTGICAANYIKDEARIYMSEDFFWRINSGTLATYCRFEQGKYGETALLDILHEINPQATTPIIANTLMPEGSRSLSVSLMIAGVLCLTVLCAGLMVYAIYYISVVKNVVQYGQLKLVGVTESQIRVLVWMQAFRQYIIGLPAGCLAGCLIGYLVMPMLASIARLEHKQTLTIAPQYFLYAALIAFVVMYFGIRKPLQIIAKIPPIHTVGFSGATNKKRKEGKSGKFTLSSFALKNLGIRKKKTVVVSFSMLLAVMLFVVTTNLVNSMNLDAFLTDISLPADIVIANEDALEDISVGIWLNNETIPSNLQEEIADICEDAEVVNYYNLEAMFYLDEFEATEFNKILVNMEPKKVSSLLLERVDEYFQGGKKIVWTQDFSFYDFEQLEKCTVLEGELDKEKFESGEYVIVVAFNEKGDTVYHAGDEVELCNEYVDWSNYEELTIEDGIVLETEHQETKTYKVLAVVRDYFWNKLSVGYDEDISFKYILPTGYMDQMFQAPNLQVITIDTEDAEYLETIEPLVVERIADAGEGVSYSSRSAYEKEMEEFGMLLALIGNGLAFVVGIMSAVNFINNCVSSIAERKEEFRTLHAIGMTKDQLVRELRLENFYTVVFAILPGLILGHVLSAIAINKVSETLPYFVFDMTILPGVILAVILCLLAMIYPNRKTDVGDR